MTTSSSSSVLHHVRTHRHPLPRAAHHPAVVSHTTSRPSYGVSTTAGSGSYVEEDYDDDEEEDWELEEELAKLDGYYESEDDGYSEDMGDFCPSSVPNRLGETAAKGDGTQLKTDPDDPRLSCLGLPLSLPYEVETLAEMDDRLDLIVCRLIECVKAREWGTGFRMWDSALTIWCSMGYPMKKEMKIKLIFLYYETIFVPGIEASFIEEIGNQFISLVSDRSLDIYDFRIQWRPLYDALYNELFPHPGKFARHSVNLAPLYLNMAESSQRFFHPGDVDEMLDSILPTFAPSMDSILATQTFLVHFLPVSHCQKWLPLMFRLWYGFNSGLWDDQASDLMGQLAITHVDPAKSDPSIIERIPRGTFNTAEEEAKNPNHKRTARGHKARLLDVSGEIEEDEDGTTYWPKPELLPPEEQLADPAWQGIRKDVGIFTEQEFEFIMTKCLRSLNVPVGGSIASHNAMSNTMADGRASKKILEAKKPIDRVQSLAETIIFCMSEDAPVEQTRSSLQTPGTMTPVQPGISRLQNGTSLKRGQSSDSLAAAGQKSDADRRYLGGSKALDHLSRLLTSCETFFHPSNSGNWSVFLTVFLSHLASNFAERWKSEEEPTCKTPAAWRLTPAIKREFVLCLRPLGLTAMFNKDMESFTSAIGALKKLALLEPDLILPALMERVVPSLQGLEETQRTLAVTYAIATMAQPLAARQIWRNGGVFVADIFALLIPGIDLNDPAKTGLSCMAISNMVDLIRLGDISEQEESDDVKPGTRAMRRTARAVVEEDPNDVTEQAIEDLSPEEVNSRVRFATSAFRDWVPEFLGRVLLLFANLPEEGGKSGRAGGKSEAMTLHSVLHTCGNVFAGLDDRLFDQALDQIAEYASTTCRANAVEAISELVRNIASADALKTSAKLFPICRQRIVNELQAGASSTRTTTTSVPVASDAALHWWQAILHGMLVPGRITLSGAHRSEYLDLLRVMIASTHSERGWSWTGRIIEQSMYCLTTMRYTEMRLVNKDEFEGGDFQVNHHLWWGKMYRAAEIHPDWRVPSKEDIDMALELITIAGDAVTKLDGLLDSRAFGDNVWSNEFCRAIHVVDKVLRGSCNLVAEIDSEKTGGKLAESYLPAEILKLPPSYKSGALLVDPKDPRYQIFVAFRIRVGETLHRAANVMRDVGESDNSVDPVKLLVVAIATFLMSYGTRPKQLSNAQDAYAGMMASKKLYESQRKHHRSIFMAAASVHHQNRSAALSFYRTRSGLDDKLIGNMLDFCLSPFVRVRRSAQSSLEALTRLYRGAWVVCFPTLFEALQPGTDPDRMKGALYVLRYNHVGLSRIAGDWRQLVQLTECLLNAHHENKASVQALVTKATSELLSRIQEPVSFDLDIGTKAVDAAADSASQIIGYKADADIVKRLHEGTMSRTVKQDEQWDVFVDRVIALAANPQLNWRYTLSASKFLLAISRRDRPIDVRLARYFAENVQNPHPRIRDLGIGASSRLLFHVAIRSFCQGSEERLFLKEPAEIFTSKIDLTDTSPAFTERYLASFRESLPDDQSTVRLQDRLDTGWLVWGRQMEVSRLPGWDEQVWSIDPGCKAGMAIFEGVMSSPGFWQQIADHWQLEDTRTYPSAQHMNFVIALAQLFGKTVFEAIRPIMENYLSEMEATKDYDRHKMRALWEFLTGLIRGSEEWPGRDSAELWNWLTPKLPELFNNIRHDTTKCWDVSVEYLLIDHDPRRYKPLVDFCLNTALSADFQGGSAFDLTRRVQVVRSIARCLQWRFNAWADDFVDLYFRSITCPYAEVRALMASVLNSIDQLKFYPSFPSTAALVATVLGDSKAENDFMQIRTGRFMPQLQNIMSSLPKWKEERPHGPKAALSDHDTAASTALGWLAVELSDVHSVGTFPYIIPFLAEIFEIRDLSDNVDLQRTSGKLLALVTSITPALDLIDPLMAALISILQNSASWRTKIHSMPVLSLVYFRNLSLLSETCKARCLDVVAACLRDQNQEVREMASVTLSAFLRCSQRSMIVVLKDRFTRDIKATVLPKRRDSPGQINPEYQAKLVELHGAVLGATALVEAFPYTVPKFLPKLLADVLAPRVSDPAPISTTIRSCVASFKRTHEKYQDKFSEDELSTVNYAQAGNSYYA